MPHEELVSGHAAKLLDRALIEKHKLTESDLMLARVRMRLELFLRSFLIIPTCRYFLWPGKNGLDGLNLARHAKSAGHAVRVYMSESSHSKNFLEKQSLF